MSELPTGTLERLLAGELSAADERRLAQAALDDPDLFDQLTAAAAITTAQKPQHVEVPHRWRAIAIVGGALAASIVASLVYLSRSAGDAPSPIPVENISGRSASAPSMRKWPPGPVATAPILLTASLDAERTATFRADAAFRRVPKDAGVVTSVDDGTVEIDLGAIDGMTQGLALANGLTITTVFRERSRGRTGGSPAVRQGDRVSVPPDVYAAAVIEQLAARRTSGDLTGAAALAETALTRAGQSGASPDLTARLANELAVLQIERGDYQEADRTLQTVRETASAATMSRVQNNRGAAAALRGDRAAAETFYRDALAGAASAERAAIEKNLAALAR